MKAEMETVWGGGDQQEEDVGAQIKTKHSNISMEGP